MTTSLTIFRLDYEPNDAPPDGLDEVLTPEALVECDEVYDLVDNDVVARLYVPSTWPAPPRWAGFVQQGFPEVRMRDAVNRKALMVLALQRDGQQRLFAIPFGHTRSYIHQDLIETSFGRRTVLNLVYEPGDDQDTNADNRIRQVDVRTIESNVRRSREQRSRDTTFETFGVDPDRDLLDRIVGVPRNKSRFGSRVTGGRSTHLDVSLRFADLPELLWDIDAAHGQTTYQEYFSWVDKVTAVKDPTLVDRLKHVVLDLVRNGSDELDMAPPEIVDWDQLATFTYEFGEKLEYTDLRLEDYMEAIEGSRVQELTPKRMASHRVSVRDGDGMQLDRWPVFRCLTGEFEFEGGHYVLDEGHFYTVSPDYLSELRAYIADLPEPAIRLPATTAERLEGPYNEQDVVGSDPERLLLDQKNVQPAGRTTPIEICDVMTTAGELVHLKRKLGSSNLSHLFAQGYVSADTLHAGPDSRMAVRAKVDEQAKKASRVPETFTTFLDEPFSPQGLTVVYAILADWKGQRPCDRLPFFSMVNLRHYRKLMRQMGFEVAFAAVNAM